MRSAENTTRSGIGQDAAGASDGDRRRTRITLFVVFAVALVVRAAAAWFAGSAEPQEVRYITIARGIISGQGYHGLDHRFPDIIQPPLYPMLVSLALLLPGPDLGAARGVSILMGALLVFPCAAIGRRLFGEKVARRSACLVAVYPLLADISSAAITESTFALLVTFAALVIWRAVETEGPTPWVRAGGAGLLLGFAFLTRPEGLIYLMAACLVCVVAAVWRRGSFTAILGRLRPIPLLVAGFVVVISPYLVWVHAQTSHWLLAPKAILYEVHETLRLQGQRENWIEPYNSLLFSERVKFGLNKDATAVRAHEQFSAASAGLTDGLMVSDDEESPALGPLMAVRLVLHNFSELYLETMKYGFVIPSLLLILAGVGLLSHPWTGSFRLSAFIVLIFMMGSLTFLVSHVEPRFLYTAMPFLLPWVAEGWLAVEIWALASVSGGRTDAARPGILSRRRIVRAVVGALVVAASLLHLPPAVAITGSLWSEHREMGLWLGHEIGTDHLVMAATPVIAYYAGTRFEVLPYADLDHLLAFARHRGVEYLVADRAEFPTFRPQLTSLLIPERPHPGLELVKAMHEGTPHAIFLYRVVGPSEAAR